MKKIAVIIFAGFLISQHLYGQLSFTEKRQRDKALNEGITYIIQEEYELANVKFNECLRLDSTFSLAYLNRGRILLEWGIIEDAMDDLDLAILFDPSLGEAYFYKGYILYGEDTTGTDARLFNQAIDNGFTDAWAYYFRGLTNIREGNDVMALNDFNEAIKQEADFALAYHERAGIKRRLGDLQGAHFDYKTAIEYQPTFPNAYNNMGSVKILLGDYEGAIMDYSRALELDPEFIFAMNNRGYARYYFGETEGALSDFDAAITLSSKFPIATLNKASLLAGQDQVISALKLLDGALEEYPDEALLYLNRGLIRELTGDLDGACEDWNMAKDLGAEEASQYITECNNL
jgi:tetratricopeptide (TPR) repeat protein